MSLAFLPKEIDDALAAMKMNTASWPDGWPVAMIKCFWLVLKETIFAICNGFALGMVDISRLNYDILPLILKVQGTDNIRQFRPIALINVPLKICAKACASRMSPIAHRIINHT